MINPFEWSHETYQNVASNLNVDLQKGLSSEEVKERVAKYGKNELDEEEGESIWDKIMEQFEDLLVRLLLGAAIISFVVSYFTDEEADSLPPWIEPCVIFIILIANGFIAIYQDYNSDKAVQALKCLQSEKANVLRHNTGESSKW